MKCSHLKKYFDNQITSRLSYACNSPSLYMVYENFKKTYHIPHHNNEIYDYGGVSIQSTFLFVLKLSKKIECH